MKRILFSLACALALLPAAGKAQERAVSNLAQPPFQVTYYDAEEAVSGALYSKGLVEKLAVTMTGHKNGAIFYHSAPVTIEVKGLQIARTENRWSASLLFVSDGAVLSAIPAGGHYEVMVELPVFKRAMRPGDIITEADLEIRDFSAGHVRNDTFSDLSALIGKTPLHSMSPSRPIKHQEVAEPSVVKKSSLVEIRYDSPGMVITAQGEAMSDGAQGAVISVRNTASKKVVRGVVSGSNSVSILAQDTRTSEMKGNTAYAN